MGSYVRNRLDLDTLHARLPSRDPTSCWLWDGYVQSGGYGQIEISGTLWLAHRLSWTLHRGKIPAGLLVLHTCDTPRCCNPDHLFLGTPADNVADMIAKGRMCADRSYAKRPRHRVLSDDAVRAILSSSESLSALARLHGVARGTIWNIRVGKSKKHLRPEPEVSP